ncbi:MAG: glycosyltransferase [Clostridia bacterium]|nr:glycosyltransferase [Clostridia bacterium]
MLNDPKKVKLSIIVPVFNVGTYLAECLDSLTQQDVPKTEYEIICVDDGSSDGSGEILDGYARRFENIAVIHKKNGGVSSARNAGLDRASGEYVWFVDSDDFIASGALRDIIGFLNDNECDQCRILPAQFNDGERYGPYTELPPERYSRKVVDYLITRILRRSHIEDAGLRFNEAITYQEDNVFYTTLYPYLQSKTELTGRICYFYRIRQGSLSRGGVDGERILSSLIAGAEDMKRLYETDGDRYNGYAFVLYAFMTMVMQTIAASPKKFAGYMAEVKSKGLFPLKYDRQYTEKKIQPGDSFLRKSKKRVLSIAYTRPGYLMLRVCYIIGLLP